MSWRWYKRIRLPFGINANFSKGGLGWSWGLGIIRYGVSPNGKKWISIGIPGTGFRFFRYVDNFWGKQKTKPNITKKSQIPNKAKVSKNDNSTSNPSAIPPRKKYPPLRVKKKK